MGQPQLMALVKALSLGDVTDRPTSVWRACTQWPAEVRTLGLQLCGEEEAYLEFLTTAPSNLPHSTTGE